MNTDQSKRVEQILEPIERTSWTGPDRNTRVEQCIKEKTMKRNKPYISRTGIALIALGVFGGGALATAVTVMAQRLTIITDDGQEFEIELIPDGEGASGTFVTDDGEVYDINMIDQDNGEKQISVDVTTGTPGTPGTPGESTSTVTIEDDD